MTKIRREALHNPYAQDSLWFVVVQSSLRVCWQLQNNIIFWNENGRSQSIQKKLLGSMVQLDVCEDWMVQLRLTTTIFPSSLYVICYSRPEHNCFYSLFHCSNSLMSRTQHFKNLVSTLRIIILLTSLWWLLLGGNDSWCNYFSWSWWMMTLSITNN